RRLAGPLPGDDQHLGGVLGRVRAVPRISRRATHRRLHHERDREPECPVPAGGAPPGPLPQRASSVESALPRRHREADEPNQPPRAPHPRATHPPRPPHPPRRPQPGRQLTMKPSRPVTQRTGQSPTTLASTFTPTG